MPLGWEDVNITYDRPLLARCNCTFSTNDLNDSFTTFLEGVKSAEPSHSWEYVNLLNSSIPLLWHVLWCMPHAMVTHIYVYI